MIAAIIVVACGATALASFVWMDPIYQASTKLIVNKSDDKSAVTSLDLNTVNLNIRLIDTYKEIIKTSAIMDTVVSEHPEFGLTSEQLMRKVQVSSVNNTAVMTVSIQDKSYAKAADIVNAISNVFVKQIPEYMKVDNVSLLTAADPGETPSPVKPNPMLNLAIAFVVSLMIGVGIALLIEYLDDTIRTDKDVEQYLNVPTIAMIPRIKEEDMQSRKRTAYANQGREQHVDARS